MSSLGVEPVIGMRVHFACTKPGPDNQTKTVVGFGTWFDGTPTVEFDIKQFERPLCCFVEFWKSGKYEIENLP